MGGGVLIGKKHTQPSPPPIRATTMLEDAGGVGEGVHSPATRRHVLLPRRHVCHVHTHTLGGGSAQAKTG